MASGDLARFPPLRPDKGPTTHRSSSGDDHFHRPLAAAPSVHAYASQSQIWGRDDDSGSEVEEEEDYDEIDEEAEGLVGPGPSVKHSNTSSGSVQSSSDKIFGSSEKGGDCSRGVVTEHRHMRDQMERYGNEITVVEPELFHGVDGADVVRKEAAVESRCGFGGRSSSSLATGESLRVHLSDPITGVLMDDAMILRCGHSYSSTGMQQIYKMKACYKCSQPIPADSARPNLSLRAAIQAFRREEELQSLRASKRKRDRLDLDKCGYDDSCPMDSRGKGVQFPFVVADRVIIKGNKRTPERFVGRMAVVTTQCLNGWYVVKTMDNAESVKLQYRSLAKVTDDSSINMLANKSLPSNWR